MEEKLQSETFQHNIESAKTALRLLLLFSHATGNHVGREASKYPLNTLFQGFHLRKFFINLMLLDK